MSTSLDKKNSCCCLKLVEEYKRKNGKKFFYKIAKNLVQLLATFDQEPQVITCSKCGAQVVTKIKHVPSGKTHLIAIPLLFVL